MADRGTQQSEVQTGVVEGAEQLVQSALELNKKRQDELKAKLNLLQSRLSKVDDTIKQVESVEEAELPEGESIDQNIVVSVPGSFKPVGILSRTRIIQPNSPFHQDALRRQKYIDYTTASSMTQKEQEAILKHVMLDNKRLWALEHPNEVIPKTMGDDAFLHNLFGLDWARIAAGVSADTGLERSARSCQIRWLSESYPGVNREPWSADERNNLLDTVKQYPDQNRDWNNIALLLKTGRRPYDCVWQYQSKPTISWNPEKEKELLNAVSRYGENNWQLVALAMKDHFNATQCQTRYQQINSVPTTATGLWTKEEDDLLRRAVAKCGTSNYTAVSRLVPGRTRHQCRDRWLFHLADSTQKPLCQWSDEETERLVKAIKTLKEEYDNISWRTVSVMLNNQKSEDECQERYIELSNDPNNPYNLQESFRPQLETQPPTHGSRFSARDRRRHALRKAADAKSVTSQTQPRSESQILPLPQDPASIQAANTDIGKVHASTNQQCSSNELEASVTEPSKEPSLEGNGNDKTDTRDKSDNEPALRRSTRKRQPPSRMGA